MSTTVTMNSVVYTVPTADDVDWASQELTWKQAVASNVNTGISGLAAVVAEVNVIQAVAPNPAVMGFGADALDTSAGTYYLRPFTFHDVATSDEVKIRCPVAGVMAALYVQGFQLINGGTYTFTLRKNGVDTALTCVMADGAQTASDITHTVTVAAGDALSVSVVASAGPIVQGPGSTFATFAIKAA